MNSIAVVENGIARLKWLAAATRFEAAALRYEACLRKANFNPAQPRVPAGNPDGGQWVADAGTSVQRPGAITDFSAGRRAPRLGSRPHGHHFVSHAVYSKFPLRPETRRIFDDAKTGRLTFPHGFTKEHRAYNDAVGEKFEAFLLRHAIESDDMTPRQAREFVDEIKRSTDPRIRDLNLKIYRQQIFNIFRNRLRGIE